VLALVLNGSIYSFDVLLVGPGKAVWARGIWKLGNIGFFAHGLRVEHIFENVEHLFAFGLLFVSGGVFTMTYTNKCSNKGSTYKLKEKDHEHSNLPRWHI
jgi:hypothetical protein